MNPYIANTPEDVSAMLKVIGVDDVNDLFADLRPGLAPRSFAVPDGMSEFEVMGLARDLARQNTGGLVSFLGAGYYDHYIPAAVKSLAGQGEFVTAYTPYQPECSQGTLQALFEYQSLIAGLTDMEVANASLYDGGTALYEAVMMARRLTGRDRVVMDGGVSPIYRKILRSYTENLQMEFVETPVAHGQCDRTRIMDLLTSQTAAVIVQNPNFFGAVDDFSDIVTRAHAQGVLVIASVYPVSLGILKTPGEMGVDIVTGEGQSLGLPLNFGGPYLGFMATRRKFVRKMPGRIVGETVDREGRRCFVNTLQAREQHIRREKATSNICTNVALGAIQSAIYMSLLGPGGLRELADLNLRKAEFARQELARIPGVVVKRSAPTFNEFTVCLPRDAAAVVEEMIPRGFAAGFPLGRYYEGMGNYLAVAVTEKRTREEIQRFAGCLAETLAS